MQFGVAQAGQYVQTLKLTLGLGQRFVTTDQHQIRGVDKLHACRLPGIDEPFDVLARLASAYAQPVALRQFQRADIGRLALEALDQQRHDANLVPRLGKQAQDFARRVARRQPDLIGDPDRMGNREVVSQAIDTGLEPRAVVVLLSDLKHIVQLQHIAQPRRLATQWQPHVDVGEVNLDVCVAQGARQEHALEAQPVRYPVHRIQWRGPLRRMDESSDRVVIRRHAEQLQLNIGVRAKGFFEREVLATYAADGVTGCCAVIKSYTHERDPCLCA